MPGRRFGQHFLIRESILERIAAAACPSQEPLVIEIGAGRGALTAPLLHRADRVVALEIDPELVSHLHARFAHEPKLEVVQTDVLEANLARWGPAVISGNLPYYITSPIIERVLSLDTFLRRAVLLVQKEVAERMTAGPGSRNFGYLSVLVQLLSKPKMLFGVPPAAFRPPPEVDSAVVLLEPRAAGDRFDIEDKQAFLKFASRCFRQKRKTLRNNLRGAFPGQSVDKLPEAALRAEQLGVEQLANVYRRLTASGRNTGG